MVRDAHRLFALGTPPGALPPADSRARFDRDRPDGPGAVRRRARGRRGFAACASGSSNPPLWLDELALANGLLAGSLLGAVRRRLRLCAGGTTGVPRGGMADCACVFPAPTSPSAHRRSCSRAAHCSATWLAARELVGERDAWVRSRPRGAQRRTDLHGWPGQAVCGGRVLRTPHHFLRAATRPSEQRAVRGGRWSLGGAVGPLFSFGAVFAIAGAGALPDRCGATAQQPASDASRVFTIWAVMTTLVSVILSQRLLSPEADAMMAVYWTPWYPPFPPTSIEEATWLPRHIVRCCMP